MNNLNTLKTGLKRLPLLTILALGLGLSPALAMADKTDSGRHNKHYSHNAKKHHNTLQYRDNKHGKRHRDSHSYTTKYHHSKAHDIHNKHVHFKHGHHNYRLGHHHGGHSHTHTNYIVNDIYHSDGLPDLDYLRFMIGLHTDNVDIILRD